jgi:hypothetical protein
MRLLAFVAVFAMGIIWSFMANAQQFECPQPLRQVEQGIKGDAAGQAQTLFRVGELQFKGQVETSVTNLFEKYPNADRVAILQNFLSISCNLLRSSTLSPDAKFDRWLQLIDALTKYLPPGERLSDTERSLAASVAYAVRRARDAAYNARQKAQQYPEDAVRQALDLTSSAVSKALSRMPEERPVALSNGTFFWGDLDSNQKPNGVGMQCCFSGSAVQYIGEFANGEIHGYALAHYKNGTEWHGFYEHSQQRLGCFDTTYELSCGKRDRAAFVGVIKRQFKRGTVITEIQFGEEDKDRNLQGVFLIRFLDDNEETGVKAGASYEGEVKDNARNGYGIYYYPNGSRYEGQWENRKMNGFGQLTDLDGKTIAAGIWQAGTLAVHLASTLTQNQ